MTTNERTIAILNGFIETTLDSAYGYKKAAGDAKNPAFKSLFKTPWLQRKQLTADLQVEVRSLVGGTPDEAGTMLAARRIFFNASVRADHDQMRDRKHSLQAQPAV